MEEFKKFLFIRKGFSSVTTDGYVSSIIRMEKKLGCLPNNSQMEQYIYEIYNSDYSYSHKTNSALSIEHYTEFLNRPLKLGRQKKPRTIIKDTLTEAEITKIIFCCKNLKEKALISLLAFSGLRNNEMCQLRAKDFDGGNNHVRVIRGKNFKDGISQISAECSKLVQQYIQNYNIQNNDYLFKTYQGNQYSSWALRKRVKVISKRAEINKRVYPHLFRSSLATNLLLRGADICTLKTQLRHSMIETTFSYINSIILEDRNSYNRFVPSYL